MKLFQQLLIAPAALGLLAPLSANASEVNLDAISNYSKDNLELDSNSFQQKSSSQKEGDHIIEDCSPRSISSLNSIEIIKDQNFIDSTSSDTTRSHQIAKLIGGGLNYEIENSISDNGKFNSAYLPLNVGEVQHHRQMRSWIDHP